MPDLRPVERYIAQLGRVEMQAVALADRAWRAARAELLDHITTGGAGLPQQIERTIINVSAQIGGGLQLYEATQIDTISTALVASQTGLTPLQLFTTAPDLLSPMLAWRAATYGMFLSDLNLLRASGADAAAIIARLISGDGRQSAFQQARVSLQLATEQAIWAAGNGHVARLADLAGERQGRQYQKQAIAAIDSRTTDCCLKVHGQIQDLDRPFQLSGTPRYADRVQNPPFHHRCRTATALYLREMEEIGTSTETMRAQAQAALRSRTPGGTHHGR